jgi:hypothetical protein
MMNRFDGTAADVRDVGEIVAPPVAGAASRQTALKVNRGQFHCGSDIHIMADATIDRLRTSEFRKVELQSPADLQHLEATARRAAREKIDRALPPSAAANGSSGEGDVLRRRVEQLVDEYLKNTFQGVRTNVMVNGVDVEMDEKAAQDEGMLYSPRITGNCMLIIAIQSSSH